MENKHSQVNNQRGSATVEAVVGFTVFLLAIFTILGTANFCRAQMMVSAAVDAAAKELSQYAYFYEMSGLQKFEMNLDDNAKVGKDNINEVIGTVDQLYGSLVTAKDKTVQTKTDVENMISAGEVDFDTLESAVTGLEESAEGVKQGIFEVSEAFENVGNNPLLYMRSLVAIIGSEGMEAAKRAVAVPLAKSFVASKFGDSDEEIQKNLESLGIEGGLEGMNFNLSKIFSDDNHENIELTVFYKVKLFQVYDWVVLEATVSKVAVCRAWLGGDNLQESVDPTQTAELGAEEAKENMKELNGKTEDVADETTEETEPEVETGDYVSDETVDTQGSFWHIGEDGYGYEDAGRDVAFLELFKETYNIDEEQPGYYWQQVDDEGEFTGSIYRTDCATGVESFIFSYFSEMIRITEQMDKGLLPEDVTSFTYVLYVPENISDEEYEAIVAAAEKSWEDFYTAYNVGGEEFQAQFADVAIDVSIVRAGGNYDYSSEEGEG